MRFVLTTAFILTVGPATLHGQVEKINALTLESGTRARILGAAPDSRFALITVASATPDSLHYSLAGSSNTRSLAWQQITKMEASAGRHRHVGRGAVFGLLIGPPLLIWDGANGQHGEERTLNELGGFFGGAVLGPIIGGTVGFFWRTEKWIPVYLPHPAITLESGLRLLHGSNRSRALRTEELCVDVLAHPDVVDQVPA
jgi:hypothetical protein